MLYMVELNFAAPERAREWEDWYSRHLRTLLAMPGFNAVQRFKADAPAASPFLAIYEIDSPAVLETHEYRARGGPGTPGEWIPLMVDWHRNIFDGLHSVPAVRPDEVLILIDRFTSEDPPFPTDVTALKCIGLDRTVHERGLSVCWSGVESKLLARVHGARVRVFRPLMDQMRNPASAQ